MNPNIQLTSVDRCTGCAACVSVCPTSSISMCEDREGFLQPNIDVKTCIKCHRCEKICPLLNSVHISVNFETQVYAVINPDEDIRRKSSSGGVFYVLAKLVIEQGGVVFGARFNKQWEVVHDYTETLNGIEPFMRSKYVQSRVGDTFKQAKQFLEQGRWVLYSGTPCQIAGLRAFLHKEYDRLIMVDVVCHGVPSPKVWKQYWHEAVQGDTLLDFNFRDKKDGWKGFQCVTTTTTTTTRREKQMENVYFRGFLKNIYLRRSCYNCAFKSIEHCSDITLADFWGVHKICPTMDDDNGTSAVFCQTQKGYDLLMQLKPILKIAQQAIEDVLLYNTPMVRSMEMPARRKDFYRAFRISHSFQYASRYVDKDRLGKRIMRKITRVLHIKQ